MAADTAARAVTHRRVLAIALPIVLSNATVPILGAVDTAVVGQIDDPAPIGAVGLGAIVLASLYWVFGFLRMGTAGLASQAEGAGDRAEVSALLTRSLLVGLAGGVLLIVLQAPLFWAAFKLSPASGEVETLARGYMQIRIFSAPAAIAIFALTGWLIALENTRAVFALQLWMNGVNILLDVWFVLGLGWGVNGVALATFIAEWSALGLGLYLCRAGFRGGLWRDWAAVFHRARLWRMMVVNTDILIRSLMIMAIFTSFLFLGADFGDVTLAANQVLLQFLYITGHALDGFAFAAEAVVGQAMGARARDRLRRGALFTSFWGGVSAVLLTLVFAVAGPAIIDLMTVSEAVRGEARLFLVYLLFMPLLGLPAFMLDGIFIGATATRDMRNMAVASFAIYLAALAVLLPGFGNHGLWLALLVSFVARGGTLALRYRALEARAAPVIPAV